MTRALIVIAAATLMLAACGKRGELERPPPHAFPSAPVAPGQ